MKTIKKLAFVALAFAALGTAMTSCSKDEDKGLTEEYIKKNIIGKWKVVSNSLGDILTDKQRINTFEKDGKVYITETRYRDGEFYWNIEKQADYKITKDVLSMSYNYASTTPDEFTVTKLTADEMGLKYVVPREQGKLTNMTLKRVTVDYSKDILGLWEGVSMTGYETYGDANHRIEFKADGTYDYYNKVDGQWVDVDDDCRYAVDGDWLATCWRGDPSSDFFFECWDIDVCNADELKLSALRQKEDGSRFKTTFNWKRVK